MRRGIRVDAHEPSRVPIGQGSKPYGVNGREHRGRRADAQADREQDRRSQRRRARQAAQADRRVVEEIPDAQRPLHLMCLHEILPHAVTRRPLSIAELASRLAPRIDVGPTVTFELVDTHRQVRLDLFLDVGVDLVRPAPEEPEGACSKSPRAMR